MCLLFSIYWGIDVFASKHSDCADNFVNSYFRKQTDLSYEIKGEWKVIGESGTVVYWCHSVVVCGYQVTTLHLRHEWYNHFQSQMPSCVVCCLFKVVETKSHFFLNSNWFYHSLSNDRRFKMNITVSYRRKWVALLDRRWCGVCRARGTNNVFVCLSQIEMDELKGYIFLKSYRWLQNILSNFTITLLVKWKLNLIFQHFPRISLTRSFRIYIL